MAKKNKSKVITIEIETSLNNKQLKDLARILFENCDPDEPVGRVKQVQVTAVDATK